MLKLSEPRSSAETMPIQTMGLGQLPRSSHPARGSVPGVSSRVTRGQACLLVVACLALVVPGNAMGQEEVSSAEWARGFQGLNVVAAGAGLQQIPADAVNEVDPETTVLILLGDLASVDIDYVGWLRRGGGLLIASDTTDGRSLLGLGMGFENAGLRTRRSSDGWRGISECPVVTAMNRDHPALDGIDRLVTNRPALLRLSRVRMLEGTRSLALLPPVVGYRSRPTFAVSIDSPDGGRAMVTADPSMFSNQMLTCGDNALFAFQALQWVAARGQTRVLLVIDGEVADPMTPDQMQVRLPPPTREEVLRALQNLPPDKLTEFGNTVAAIAEDEGLVNAFLASVFDKAPDLLLRQMFIAIPTALLVLWLWFRYFSRDTLVESVAGRREHRETAERRSARKQVAVDRQRAAQLLVNDFMLSLRERVPSERSLQADKVVLVSTAMTLDHDPQRELSEVVKRLGADKPGWWTRQRLATFHSRLGLWKSLLDDGILTVRTSGNDRN